MKQAKRLPLFAAESTTELLAEQDAQIESKDAESICRKRKAAKLQKPLLP